MSKFLELSRELAGGGLPGRPWNYVSGFSILGMHLSAHVDVPADSPAHTLVAAMTEDEIAAFRKSRNHGGKINKILRQLAEKEATNEH